MIIYIKLLVDDSTLLLFVDFVGLKQSWKEWEVYVEILFPVTWMSLCGGNVMARLAMIHSITFYTKSQASILYHNWDVIACDLYVYTAWTHFFSLPGSVIYAAFVNYKFRSITLKADKAPPSGDGCLSWIIERWLESATACIMRSGMQWES